MNTQIQTQVDPEILIAVALDTLHRAAQDNVKSKIHLYVSSDIWDAMWFDLTFLAKFKASKCLHFPTSTALAIVQQ